ncbi:MAG: 3'-5' exonuclease [Pseudonocardiaceae bacterium]
MGDLTSDDDFRATTFVVIDFESTTPVGHRPEPIDVATIQLRVRDGQLVETGRFSALIRPPEHAPITRFDTEQTGITPQMVAHQPLAVDVLATLDAGLGQPPYLLVAHHAPTEAGILHDYRDSCPRLADTDFLDTVRLARGAYPDLPSHRLDVLMIHLQIPRPINRHRALPDTTITAQLFTRLLTDGARTHRWGTLRQLRQIGGYRARASLPRQEALFD